MLTLSSWYYSQVYNYLDNKSVFNKFRLHHNGFGINQINVSFHKSMVMAEGGCNDQAKYLQGGNSIFGDVYGFKIVTATAKDFHSS